MHTVPGLGRSPAFGGVHRLGVTLMALVFLSACTPSDQAVEELRKEVQALKTQMAVTQEKLSQVQTGQQAIMDLLKKSEPAPAPQASTAPPPMVIPAPAAPEPLTVGDLLAAKDRYLGTRVKVKGMPGPVMVHHKSLMLKSPQGMIEVLFGNLPDPKVVQSLTSATLDKPLTVTGVVNLPPAKGAGAQLQIAAEAVEF
jgi:hypothetical protein